MDAAAARREQRIKDGEISEESDYEHDPRMMSWAGDAEEYQGDWQEDASWDAQVESGAQGSNWVADEEEEPYIDEEGDGEWESADQW